MSKEQLSEQELEDIELTELRQFVYVVELKFAPKFNGHGDVNDTDLYILYTRAKQLREQYSIMQPPKNNADDA